jgi:hypothetical protein
MLIKKRYLYILRNSYAIIFCALFFTLLFSNLGLLIHVTINPYYLPIAAILALIFVYLFEGKKDKQSFIISIAITITISFISYYLGCYYYDFSYDGMSYHQEAIVDLSKGWNPVYENSKSQYNLWLDHYQKGIEILQANFYSLINRIESGKMLNFLLAISTLLVVIDALSLIFKNWMVKISLAIFTTFPLVVIGQLFTIYNDGLYYLLTISLLALLFLFYENKNVFFGLLLVAVSVMMCSIKFSTIPTFVIITFACLAYIFYKKEWKLIKPTSILIGVIAIMGLLNNVNPIVTNLAKGKHVFHPLMGQEKVDIISHIIPPYMHEQNKFERFKSSFFSRVSNDFHPANPSAHHYHAKFPFTIYPTEIDYLSHYDLRLSGFGLFSSGIFLLAMLILIFYPILLYKYNPSIWKNDKQKYLLLYGLVITILFTIFINPEFWWARYVPQMWLLPILALIIIWNNSSQTAQGVKWFMFFSLFFNFYTGFTKTLDYEFKQTEEMNSLIDDWKTSESKLLVEQKNFNHVYKRFVEKGIDVELGEIKDKNFILLPNTYNNVKVHEISNIHHVETLKLTDLNLSESATLSNLIDQFHQDLIVISVRDEATENLQPQDINYLKDKYHLHLDQLPYRGSYILVMHQGKVMEEIFDKERIEIKGNDKLKPLGISKIISSGYNSGNFSSIKMFGSELSLNKRGMNIVLVKDKNTYQLNLDSFEKTTLDSLVLNPIFNK